jgi:hypothetical protein
MGVSHTVSRFAFAANSVLARVCVRIIGEIHHLDQANS